MMPVIFWRIDLKVTTLTITERIQKANEQFYKEKKLINSYFRGHQQIDSSYSIKQIRYFKNLA